MMKGHLKRLTSLTWLSQVREYGPVLDQQHPIWVRRHVMEKNQSTAPPHRHPYCEFSLFRAGVVQQFVEGEQITRRPGSLFFAGPDVPHWPRMMRGPTDCIVVYFVPRLLLEMSDVNEGAQLLYRFTAARSLSDRFVRPPSSMKPRIHQGFDCMLAEFEGQKLGCHLRLQSQLVELLVDILRWEDRTGRKTSSAADAIPWSKIEMALRYLQTHFSETVYRRDLAAAVHINESQLNLLFRKAMGTTWVKYLQAYRVHQAVALLLQGRQSVAEIALAAGFENLAHFNTTFQSYMGMAPTEYEGAKNRVKTARGERK